MFELESILNPYDCYDEQALRDIRDKLNLYHDLLKRWNQAVDLVSPDTIVDSWSRHILDSAQLLPFIWGKDSNYRDNTSQKKIVDFGSGAGFPGMVLAIMGVKNIILMEANERKCRFLEEVAACTKSSVQIINARIEDLPPWKVDFVISRALAPLEELLSYVFPYLSDHSQCIFLKGKGVEQEIEKARMFWTFSVEKFPSKTSCHGRVIRVKHIRKGKLLS